MRRRVKITGLGPVTPAGIGRDDFFRGINESVSRVRSITNADSSSVDFIGAQVVDFDLRKYFPDENPRRLSVHTQFALVGAMLALRDAGISLDDLKGTCPMIITGTSVMDIGKISRGVQIVSQKGPRYSMPSTIYETSVVNVPGKISEYIGVPSRMFSLQSACCSGLDAIGQAAEFVASGQTDIAITGGSEAPLSYHPLLEFNTAELNPTNSERPERACRPFDLWRSTGVIGEGAGILILEPEESPRPAIAWVSGYGFANDPDGRAGSGIAEATELALANARRRKGEVDYINAWGPGHRVIDANEAFALKRVFGDALAEIPAVSIKGAIGTPLGATGAIQAISVALSLFRGILPPTVNWENPDPNCPLNLSSKARRIAPNVAIIDAHGLSGTNASLVIEKQCPN